MENIKKFAPITIRIIIAALFLLSAFAKLYPSPYFAITTFEFKQVIPLGFDACIAPYFSRILIALEIALGIAILQPHFLKKIVIPSTILLLSVFTIHLSFVDVPNCGCFGELIPMSPNEAIIKNVISILLLVYLYRNVSDLKPGNNKFSYLLLIYAICALFLFVIAPQKPCNSSTNSKNNVEVQSENENESPFSKHVVAENYSPINIDQGRKLLCFFAPGCEHCMEAASELNELSNRIVNFPHVHIVFMDEEAEKIGDFFKSTNLNASYQVMDIVQFWNILGYDGNPDRNTPSIVYLNNGNIEKFYYYDKVEFNPVDLEMILSK